MEKTKELAMNAKAMIKEHSEKRTKIRYGTRIKLEIITDKNRFYRKGQIINPHEIMGRQLIKDGIAKEIRD